MKLEFADADGTSSTLLAALHAQCFSEGWREDAFASLLAMPGAFAFILGPGSEDNGGAVATPVGFALARAIGGESEIITLGVLPGRREKGVGAALVAAVAAKARDMASAELFLEVAADNVAAIALYKATGFVAVGRRKDYYQNKNATDAGNVSQIDAIVMRRTL